MVTWPLRVSVEKDMADLVEPPGFGSTMQALRLSRPRSLGEPVRSDDRFPPCPLLRHPLRTQNVPPSVARDCNPWRAGQALNVYETAPVSRSLSRSAGVERLVVGLAGTKEEELAGGVQPAQGDGGEAAVDRPAQLRCEPAVDLGGDREGSERLALRPGEGDPGNRAADEELSTPQVRLLLRRSRGRSQRSGERRRRQGDPLERLQVLGDRFGLTGVMRRLLAMSGLLLAMESLLLTMERQPRLEIGQNFCDREPGAHRFLAFRRSRFTRDCDSRLRMGHGHSLASSGPVPAVAKSPLFATPPRLRAPGDRPRSPRRHGAFPHPQRNSLRTVTSSKSRHTMERHSHLLQHCTRTTSQRYHLP